MSEHKNFQDSENDKVLRDQQQNMVYEQLVYHSQTNYQNGSDTLMLH